MATKIARGQKSGEWQLRESIGSGGNGCVWLASSLSKGEVAIKILSRFDGKSKKKTYERFRREVTVFEAK
jgi:hypothetical protein